MTNTTATWILTLALWSEDGTKIIDTKTFKTIQDCMVAANVYVDNYENKKDKNPNEYLTGTCRPEEGK